MSTWRITYLDIVMPKMELDCGNFGPVGSNVVKVEKKSNIKYRKAVEKIAGFFRREMQFDFLQFVAVEKTLYPYTAYLIYNDIHPRALCGAACFRWRNWKNDTPSWALQWIWIHPFERRKRLFKKIWNTFVENHSPFFVEPPYSDAMRDFLIKYNNSSGKITKKLKEK